MSYTKTVWHDGDVITAAKMNNIENGIEDATSDGGVSSSEEIIVDITEAESSVFDITIKSGLSKSEVMQILFKINIDGGVYYLQPSVIRIDPDYPTLYGLVIQIGDTPAHFVYYPESGRLTTSDALIDPEDPSQSHVK